MIYFAREVGTVGPIKIGFSRCLEARLKQLGVDWRIDVDLIAQIPGDYILERNIHLKFADERLSFDHDRPGRTEWFEASERLLAFIEEAKINGRIDLETNECRERIFAERYLAGQTLRQIGEEFGVTRERVRQVLRRSGVESLGWRPEVSRTVLRPDVEQKILALVEAGLSVPAISKEVGLNRWNVVQCLKRHNVQAARAVKQPRADIVERFGAISAEYTDGQRVQDIANRHGVCLPEIYRALRYTQTPKRGHGTPRVDNAEHIAVAYQQGKSLTEIAKRAGVTPKTVMRALVKKGVPIRDRIEQVKLSNRLRKAA